MISNERAVACHAELVLRQAQDGEQSRTISASGRIQNDIHSRVCLLQQGPQPITNLAYNNALNH